MNCLGNTATEREELMMPALDKEALAQAEKRHLAVIAAVKLEPFKSVRYLFVGTMCGVVGGFYSTFLFYTNRGQGDRVLNLDGEPFPSGNVYWAVSVSNMVSDPSSPSGKVWLAFMTLSALTTLVSWYPYYLSNVYIGEDVPLFSCFPQLSLMTARSVLPSLGMMLVALDHTGLANVYDSAQEATLIFHTGGAILWLGITVYAEVYTLFWSTKVKFTGMEKHLRFACIVFVLLGGACYLVCSSNSPSTVGLCCEDEYQVVTMDNVDKANANGAYAIAAQNLVFMQNAKFNPDAQAPVYQGMYNTAYGGALIWKMVSFWGEAIAGASMLLGLLVVWYYAKERDIEMPDSLP